MHTCPCCNGVGQIGGRLPDYARFDFSAESLHHILSNLDIDKHAKLQAFLVIQQFGDDGIKEVQSITHNILKNWHWNGNPSFFLLSSCGKFIHERETRVT